MSIDKVSLNSLSGPSLTFILNGIEQKLGVNCWWNDYKLYNGGTQLQDDDMDNNSVTVKMIDVIERWRDLRSSPDLIDENGNPYNIFLGYWDAAYATGGSTPVASFCF